MYRFLSQFFRYLWLVVLVAALGAASPTPSRRVSPSSRPAVKRKPQSRTLQVQKPPARAKAKASTPLLYPTAKRILNHIYKHESRRDATCWTTVRMMEHFYARKSLNFHASLLKIEASKILLYRLWKKASSFTPAMLLQAKHIDAVAPQILTKGASLLGRAIQGSTRQMMRRTKLNHYHKVTENWRLLLAIALDSMIGRDLFVKGVVDIKPLSKRAAYRLAQLSTAMTVRLLKHARKAALRTKHHHVEVSDIQAAYRILQRDLGLKQKTNVSPPHPFAQPIRNTTLGHRLVRQIVVHNMKHKIQSLRSWNRSVWKGKQSKKQMLYLLKRLTQVPLTLDELELLLQKLETKIKPLAQGISLREQMSMGVDMMDLTGTAKHLLKRDQRSHAPKRIKYLTLLNMANALTNVAPLRTQINGDVDFRYVVVATPMDRPSRPKPVVKERSLTGPALDAIRDTTIHWYLLHRLWKKHPKLLAMDPFAMELLSERVSEMAWFYLKEMKGFYKRYEKKIKLGQGLFSRWGHTFFETQIYHFVDFPSSHSKWKPALQKAKKKLLQEYKTKLFQEQPGQASGLHPTKCQLSTVWFAQRGIPIQKKANLFRKGTIDKTFLGLQAWMGGGIAVGDYDNDGRPDLFFAGEGCNRLYRNMGNFRFHDMTRTVGIHYDNPDTRQALFVDINNDGRLDLFVVSATKPSQMYLQLNNGRFKNITRESGVHTTIGSHSATFFDYNNDGLLDLYIGYYGARLKRDFQRPSIDGTNGRPNVLYQNMGNGRFRDVTVHAGLYTTAWTVTVSALDLNQDGHLDLWLANDFGYDQVFLNQGNGKFRDVAGKMQLNDRGSGMNVSVTDINNDGRWDVYVSVIDMFSKSIRFILPVNDSTIPLDDRILRTSFYLSGNKFFVSQGKGAWHPKENRYFEPGFRGWSWAASFFDYDNDGDEDMYLTNGWERDSFANKQRNQLFLRHKSRYFLHPGPSPVLYKGNSRGATTVDLDNNGTMDLVLNDFRKGPRLFKNIQKTKNNWIKFNLRGTQNNHFGVGATVKLKAKGLPLQMKQVSCGINYLSQESTTLMFGLGKSTAIEYVQVLWPGGGKQIIKKPDWALNKTHTIVENVQIRP